MTCTCKQTQALKIVHLCSWTDRHNFESHYLDFYRFSIFRVHFQLSSFAWCFLLWLTSIFGDFYVRTNSSVKSVRLLVCSAQFSKSLFIKIFIVHSGYNFQEMMIKLMNLHPVTEAHVSGCPEKTVSGLLLWFGLLPFLCQKIKNCLPHGRQNIAVLLGLDFP